MAKNNILLFGGLPNRLKPMFNNHVVERLNLNTDTLWSSMKMIARDHFNNQALPVSDEVIGVVLRVDGMAPPPPGHILFEYYSNIDELPMFLHLKIRVPEIHIGYPIPDSEEDMISINRYPTFLSLEQSPQIQPAPGTLVIVKYLDNVNYASPVYVRSVQPDKSLESIVDGVERVYTTTLQPLFACARNDIGLKT